MEQILKQISAISNLYYNDGLEKAGIRDLSGAKRSLQESLKFNKSNIAARNLLGLIYFETGEVTEALGQWVISKNLSPEDNLADKYINELRNDPNRLDALNQTNQKFNVSLKYCHQDGNDLAIIQLKKILSVNPRYVKAHLLLGLLYLNGGDYKKAERELNRALKIDNGSVMAKRYLEEVRRLQSPEDSGDKTGTMGTRSGDVIEYRSGNETIIQPVNNMQPKGTVSMISLAIGAVLGVAVALFLILPARIQAVNNSNKERITAISEESDAKSAKITEYEQQLSQLQTEMESLQGEINSFQGTDATMEAMNDLMAAASAYLTDASDHEKIAEYMENVNPTALGSSASAEFVSLYDSLVALEGERLSSIYYQAGYEAYRNEDYETAIAQLSLAVQYNADNSDALFNLANAYNDSGDADTAKKTYDRVIRLFPGTRLASNAEAKIAEINNASD